MELFNQELADADQRFAALVAEDPIVKRLTTCPSVGLSRRRPSSRRSITCIGLLADAVPPRWRVIWGSCHASTAPVSNNSAAVSCALRIPTFACCWCKRPDASVDHRMRVRRTAHLSSGHRASTGQEYRDRRLGAPADSDSICDVAR